MPAKLTRFTKYTGEGAPMLDCSVYDLKFNGCGTNNCRWRIVRRLARLEEAIERGHLVWAKNPFEEKEGG